MPGPKFPGFRGLPTGVKDIRKVRGFIAGTPNEFFPPFSRQQFQVGPQNPGNFGPTMAKVVLVSSTA